MKFSIIIINYKTKEITANCLNSIFQNCNKNDFEIILIDNNSQDGSAEYFEHKFSNEVILLKNKENIGFGRANNQGAKIAKGDILFFLNSDTLLKNNILAQIKSVLRERVNIGVLTPKLVLENKGVQKFFYGFFPSFFNLFLDKFRKEKTVKSGILNVDWVSGAALIIPKKIFDQVAGFDKNFFMYFEDIDLCKKVKSLGYDIVVDFDIFVIHLGGKSIGKFSKRKKYYYTSQDYFYKKYYGPKVALIIKIIRFPYKILIYCINQLIYLVSTFIKNQYSNNREKVKK